MRTLKAVLKSLEIIPSEYDGPFAEEIDALRVSLTEKIPEAEQREAERKKAEEERRAAQKKAEEERIAALKAIGIPYVGMLEKDVNSTWQLGEAYRSDTVNEWVKRPDGKYKEVSWQCYSWYSKGTGKPVFQAECRKGVVFNIIKHGGSACWDGDTLLVELGPQGTFTFNYGTGTDDEYDGDTGAGSGYSLREDYDSPEDLFEDGGFEDLDEAWDEWEEGL